MEHEFECPYCGEEIGIDSESLPKNSCDDMDFECPNCEESMVVGWVAEIEIRQVTCELGDVVEYLD